MKFYLKNIIRKKLPKTDDVLRRMWTTENINRAGDYYELSKCSQNAWGWSKWKDDSDWQKLTDDISYIEYEIIGGYSSNLIAKIELEKDKFFVDRRATIILIQSISEVCDIQISLDNTNWMDKFDFFTHYSEYITVGFQEACEISKTEAK